MLQLLLLLLRALLTGLRSRRDLALENLVLRHQLHVVLRTNPNRASEIEIESFGSGSPALAKGLAPTPAGSPAQNRPPVASQRMAAELELEVTHQTRPPSNQ